MRNKDKNCVHCGGEKRSVHFNTKYCQRCRDYFLSKPKSTMTPEQIRRARSLIGKIPREEIAQELGVSLASLKRAFRGTRLAFHNKYVRDPQLVRAVTRYYEKQGRKKTEERFPGVRLRSIIERYKWFKPRQLRWTESQLIGLAKFAGLKTNREIAAHFKRPGAYEGSIISVFNKRLDYAGANIHGLSQWVAREIVDSKCPFITTNFWRSRNPEQKSEKTRKLYLWQDIQKHMISDLPRFIADAVNALVEFEKWLWQSENPKQEILKMVGQQ